MDTFSRKASSGKFRVVGYDQYDYSDYFIDEFADLGQALEMLNKRCAKSNAIPTSFSDVYFVYDDKETALYRGTFDDGVEKLSS